MNTSLNIFIYFNFLKKQNLFLNRPYLKAAWTRTPQAILAVMAE
jgi:hypothetical protein